VTELAVEIQQDINDQVQAIRAFNRMYAHRIGALNENIFGSPFSLTEIRVLHELNLHKHTTATFLSRALQLDCGYLSRILNGFTKSGLVMKERSIKDARQRKVSLTRKGRTVYDEISKQAGQNILDFLEPLTVEQRVQMVDAMNAIMGLLAGVSATAAVAAESA
jgi:DNA-binding MarR family transcriptional regulator